MSDGGLVVVFCCGFCLLFHVGREFPLALASCCARPCRARQGQAFREQVGPDTPVEHTSLKRLASASARALRSPPFGPFWGPDWEVFESYMCHTVSETCSAKRSWQLRCPRVLRPWAWVCARALMRSCALCCAALAALERPAHDAERTTIRFSTFAVGVRVGALL